jgi:hypothetical protein
MAVNQPELTIASTAEMTSEMSELDNPGRRGKKNDLATIPIQDRRHPQEENIDGS